MSRVVGWCVFLWCIVFLVEAKVPSGRKGHSCVSLPRVFVSTCRRTTPSLPLPSDRTRHRYDRRQGTCVGGKNECGIWVGYFLGHTLFPTFAWFYITRSGLVEVPFSFYFYCCYCSRYFCCYCGCNHY